METTNNNINDFWSYFSELEDPRGEGRNKKHLLKDIIVIAIVGFAVGMKSFDAIADFARFQVDWFKKYLKLPHGIPSHDTFERVFQALDPKVFGKCFMEWTISVAKKTKGDIVAIDGKTVRNSGNKEQKAIHLVSAWSHANGLALGQLSCEEKSNEITAIPKLLDMLSLQNCVVTIDAMGCQKAITAKVKSQKADYLIPVKDNQPKLHMALKETFDLMLNSDMANTMSCYYEEYNKGHGREEIRRCWATDFISGYDDINDWTGVQSFVRIESTRKVKEKTTVEVQYLISSLPSSDPKKILQARRSHWGVENKLHWCLDVTFGEDQACLRNRNLAENTSLIRRGTMILLKIHPDFKGNLAKATRFAAFNLNFRDILINLISSNA
jgi:predicted transposase YbfD/YdcC